MAARWSPKALWFSISYKRDKWRLDKKNLIVSFVKEWKRDNGRRLTGEGKG